MWTPKQKRDKEIPYRGEPPRKYPKRRRQIRDLKIEQRRNIFTTLSIFIFLTLTPICLIFNPYSKNPIDLEQIVIVFIFALILITAIAAGLLSVNKFRKGYDIDVSDRAKKDEDKNIDDSDHLDS